jgi:hypothetical protein
VKASRAAAFACTLGGALALAPPARAEAPLSERVTCSIAAALKYSVPANLVLAVAEQEGGKPGQRQPNRNGTYDVGVMQFNSRYLAALTRYGITESDVAAAGCYPYDLATWRLAQHLKHDAGDVWQRASNYHSRTPQHNAAYRSKLIVRARKWAAWLKARYATREFEVADAADSGAAPVAEATLTGRRESPASERRTRKSAASASHSRPRTGEGRVSQGDDHVTPDEVRALCAPQTALMEAASSAVR